MSNLEHYFENLLFDGKDCRGDVNKNTLTKEEQEAVEICAQYVIWSIFDGRDDFKNFIRQEFEPIKHGKWIKLYHDNYKCSECGSWWESEYNNEVINDFNYCPNCGTRMDSEENG